MSCYFILCSNKIRHTVSAESPVVRNEKCRCFSTCSKKDTCPYFTNGEFTIITVATAPMSASAIKIEKVNDIWAQPGSAPVNPNKPAAQAMEKPVFGFKPNPEPAQSTQESAPKPAESNKPVFNFKPASNPEPAPKPAEPENKPVFNFKPQTEETKPVESNAQPAKPVFGFKPQTEEAKPAQEAPSNNAFPTRDSAPTTGAFPTRDASSNPFPTRDNQPTSNPNPLFPSRNSQPATPSSDKVQSFKDRFKSQYVQQEAKSSVLQGVSINDMTNIVLGGKMYTNDYGLQRSKGALPLSRLIDEVRGHWQVPFVFENEHKLSRQFIWLLLVLKILPNKGIEERMEALLKETIFESPVSDKNAKFFYLMDFITPASMKNGFFMSEQYSYARLAPLFTDVTDYVNKFFQDGQVGLEFRAICQRHLPEVMYYLGYTDKWPTRDNKDEFRKELLQKQESLFDDFVIRHFENTKHLVYLNKQGETFFVEDLGNYENFIQCMAFPQKLATSRAMIEFLKRLRFTSDGGLLPRDSENPLRESKKPDFEGSRVYEVLGLQSSSYYLEEYNLYLTLLQEYIQTFEPSEISINGVIYLSKLGFISEIRQILLEACEAALSSELPDREVYISKALLLYSLIARGVLNRYVAGNQSQAQYNSYLTIFAHLADNSLSVQEYSKAFGKDALFYFGGVHVNQHDYLLNSIGSWQLNEIVERVNTNNILSTYITHDRDKEKHIDDRIAAYEKTFAQFCKI